MAIRITEEAQFLRITCSGVVTAKELRALLGDLEVLEASRKPVPHRLTDLTGIERSEVNAEDVRRFAEKRVTRRFGNQFRSAIVAPQPAQYGYARMFQMLNPNPDITIEIFANVAAARAWLISEAPIPSPEARKAPRKSSPVQARKIP